jgi:cell wall-associated NlpC family hydrolase
MRTCVSIIILYSLIIAVTGCGSGTPRHTQADNRRTATERNTDTQRFTRELERAAHEERVENDVIVNVTEAGNRIVLPTQHETQILSEALRHIGTPYKLGGGGSNGIDCSGYTRLVFRSSVNIDLPRLTADQYRQGRAVRVNDLKFGDLIFFNTTGRNPSHVGIYLGDNLFAHASVTSGVTISSLNSSYFQRRLTGARRILD